MRITKKLTAFIISAAMLTSGAVGCSTNDSGQSETNCVKIMLPAASQAEQTVNVTASVSINEYLTARAYLDNFIGYDISSLDESSVKDFTDTLKNAVTAFENVEKLAAELTKTVDAWEKSTDDKKPSYKVISEKKESQNDGLFTQKAFAAEDNSAKKWAQDIVDAYDKAPAGKGIRKLAEQMGTDAKHAYAQLKQALAVLEGAEYTAIADKANTAVQVASGLKAAGTAAGLVIAVAAAPAAGTLGAVVKTGGVVCSGINTVLEVGSAGSIIYNNGEDNEISIACDKTEAQFAPIGQVFSILSLGQGLKDIGTTGKKILESGYKSLSAKELNDLGENSFGVLSYAANSLNDYISGGSILSGTFTHTDDGVEFTLWDTLTGKEDVKQTLEKSVSDSDRIEKAINGDGEQIKPDGNIPKQIADNITDKNASLVSGIDVKDFIQAVETALIEFSASNDRQSVSTTETDTTTESSEPDYSNIGDAEGWNGNFYGTTLPAPQTNGKVTEYTVKDDSITVRIDGISWEEYKDYCKTLQSLGGWQVYTGDYPEDVAHFPEDYNQRLKTYFSGSYGKLPHISVQYYSDKSCETSKKPHFCMFVFKEWN